VDDRRYDLIERNTQSFIVRIWTEDVDEAGGREIWRGHVTHLQTGKKSYVSSLPDILSFMATCARESKQG
jgi:hypothetical protein